MATMFFSKDGKRPHTQAGPGVWISLSEATLIFKDLRIIYWGSEAKDINPDSPSRSLKNVVIETNRHDGVSTIFPKHGFYFVVGILPKNAEVRLQAHRVAA